jgi:hypothetical protein
MTIIPILAFAAITPNPSRPDRGAAHRCVRQDRGIPLT